MVYDSLEFSLAERFFAERSSANGIESLVKTLDIRDDFKAWTSMKLQVDRLEDLPVAEQKRLRAQP